MDRKFIYIIGGVIGALLILFIVGLIISANSGKKNSNQVAIKTLTIWATNDDKTAFDQIIYNFQIKNKSVKIDFVKKNPDTFLQELVNSVASGNGPDIVAMPNNWMARYHNILRPINENVFADKTRKLSGMEAYRGMYPTVVSQDNIFDGKIYGVPLSVDSLFLYKNPTIVGKSWSEYTDKHRDMINSPLSYAFSEGPKTWDEMIEVSRIITKKNGSDVQQSAIALGTSNNIQNADEIVTLLMMQNGVEMTSKDFSTAKFHTKDNRFGGTDFPGTKALEFYASFADPKSLNYTWNSSFPEAVRAFAEGKTAMLIAYESQEEDIRRINPRANFVKIAIPQIRETKNPVNYASYATYAVTNSSKVPDLAWDFILFLTRDGDMKNIYQSATGKNLIDMEVIGRSSAIEAVQAKTAESWYNPDPVKVKQILRDMIKQVNEEKNSQTAIEGTATQVTSLLQQLKQ